MRLQSVRCFGGITALIASMIEIKPEMRLITNSALALDIATDNDFGARI